MILRAYLDESGIHGNALDCIVAGFVAPANVCDKLQLAWRDLLRSHRIASFHAKQFAKHTGMFKHWDDAKRKQFIIDAVHILERPDMIFVGAAIDRSAFFSRSMNERRWLTGGVTTQAGKWRHQGAPTKPYFLPFQQCVLDATKFAKPDRQSIHFIFDWQTHYEFTGKRIFAAMKKVNPRIRSRAGSITYVSRERAIPLQAADFIAYECHRILSIRRKTFWNVEVDTDVVRKLIWHNTWRTVYIDGEDITKLLQFCPLTPYKTFVLPDPGIPYLLQQNRHPARANLW